MKSNNSRFYNLSIDAVPGNAIFLFSFHENKKPRAFALCHKIRKNAYASKLAIHFSAFHAALLITNDQT